MGTSPDSRAPTPPPASDPLPKPVRPICTSPQATPSSPEANQAAPATPVHPTSASSCAQWAESQPGPSRPSHTPASSRPASATECLPRFLLEQILALFLELFKGGRSLRVWIQ